MVLVELALSTMHTYLYYVKNDVGEGWAVIDALTIFFLSVKNYGYILPIEKKIYSHI